MTRKLNELIELIDSEIAGELLRFDPNAAARYCLDAMKNEKDMSPQDRLRSFFFALWFIENAGRHALASDKAVRDAAELCEEMLAASGIKPVSSKYSGLYGRLYLALSAWTMSIGDSWLSMWHANVSQILTRPSDRDMSIAEIMIAAERAYSLGHIASAASAYFHAEENATDLQTKAMACRGRILCQRLLGDTQQAMELAAAAQLTYQELPALALEFAWEERLCLAHIEADIRPITPAWDRASPLFQAKFGLVASLMAHASANFPRKKIRRSSTLKKLDFPDVITLGTYEFRLYKMLVAIEACEDERDGLATRLNELGKFITEVRHSSLAEDQLIFFAAVSRWLAKSEQKNFLAFVLNDYMALSLSVSNGKSRDALNLIPDLLERGELVDPIRHKDNLTELPLTSSRRILKLSALVSQAGIISARNRVKSFFVHKDSRAALSDKMLNDLATFLVEELGTLKGPMMKIGQILVALDMLPVEARRQIQKALASTRVMDPGKFHAVFKAEHGKSPQQVFRNWNDEVIGVGSMAQVFRAELPDGRPVAVKIMYPNMQQAVASDLTLMRLAKPLVRNLFPAFDASAGLQLVVKLFEQECDFREEARKHQLWYNYFHGRRNVVVPRLHDQYTTRNVLVADLVKGQKVYEFARTGSLAERHAFCTTIWDVCSEAISAYGLCQFDPHGGNFLYQDGQVIFLDFGTVVQVSAETIRVVSTFIKAVNSGDDQELFQAMLSAGVLKPGIVDEAFFCEFIAPLIMQDRHPRYDPSKHGMSRFFDLYFDGDLRYALNASPEITQIFLADFLYHSLRSTLLSGNVSETLTEPDDVRKSIA